MGFEFLTETTPTARKVHCCIWCGEKIKKGEKYIRQDGLFDGDFQSNKYHAECRKAATAYFRLDKDSFDDTFEPYSFKRGTYEEQ